jgi:metal-dependent amidase/aminoacylase/carboxypeptidase family protein
MLGAANFSQQRKSELKGNIKFIFQNSEETFTG